MPSRDLRPYSRCRRWKFVFCEIRKRRCRNETEACRSCSLQHWQMAHCSLPLALPKSAECFIVAQVVEHMTPSVLGSEEIVSLAAWCYGCETLFSVYSLLVVGLHRSTTCHKKWMKPKCSVFKTPVVTIQYIGDYWTLLKCQLKCRSISLLSELLRLTRSTRSCHGAESAKKPLAWTTELTWCHDVDTFINT